MRAGPTREAAKKLPTKKGRRGFPVPMYTRSPLGRGKSPSTKKTNYGGKRGLGKSSIRDAAKAYVKGRGKKHGPKKPVSKKVAATPSAQKNMGGKSSPPKYHGKSSLGSSSRASSAKKTYSSVLSDAKKREPKKTPKVVNKEGIGYRSRQHVKKIGAGKAKNIYVSNAEAKKFMDSHPWTKGNMRKARMAVKYLKSKKAKK